MNAPNSRRPLATLLCALVLTITFAVPAPAARGASPAASAVELRSCLLTGVNFPDSAKRLTDDGWVPKDYAHMGSAPRDATVLVWSFRCAATTIDGRHHGATQLSIVGAALQYVDDKSNVEEWPNVLVPANWPGNWGIYVVRMDADNAAVVGWLRTFGMPARLARSITFTETHLVEPVSKSIAAESAETCAEVGDAPGLGHSPADEIGAPEPNKTTTVSVMAGTDSYETRTFPLGHHNAVTHCHDQLLWHGPYEDPATVRLMIPVARDHFCKNPECGAASASAGGVADFLGGSRQDPSLAFDHELIDIVHLTRDANAAP